MNKKLLIATAAALLVAACAHAQTPAPKRELRGVWISTHLSLDWPNRTQTPAQQQAALLGILDHNKATGMNAAFFQVRSQADAMYASTLEPWSYYLTNNQGSAPAPYWDPLQFAVGESHKRGLEFHAWINPYRAVANTASESNSAQYASTHVSHTHPEWLLTVGTVKILNPGLPQVRDHVAAVVADIVQRYDIDGIHFDDYFYPSGTINDDAAYNADPRGFPNTAAGRADWRRDNINMLIARIGASIRGAKPWIKFGVSPSGIYRSSSDPAVGSPTSSGAFQHYSAAFADTRTWLQQGWVDYLAPQVYWYIGQAGSDYKLLVPWWNENAFGRHIYVGLADYKMGTAGWTDPNQVANQIGMNRANQNVRGQIHFRHAFLAANTLNYRTALMRDTYKRPALLPAMPWKDSLPPGAPTALASSAGANDAVALSWTAPAAGGDEMEQAKRFVIYRSDQRQMDIEDPANLLGVTNAAETTWTDTTAGAGQYYYYTVTALNRLSSESAPATAASNDHEAPVVRTREVSRTLAGGTVGIVAADVDGGTSDNWGVESLGISKSTFSCTDIGANRVELTAVDKGGNTASATAVVNVVGSVPQPAITVTRGDTLSGNLIALGYGAQSVTLAASDLVAGSGTSFTWSPADGLSAASGATTTFAPTGAGTFAFTAQAVNENGCVGAAKVTLQVIDARCENDKVLVCNKTGSHDNSSTRLCISPNAVAAHLRKGDTLGACGQ
ncbi:MAG: family 10 glycosylhydrolase [Massilia sp.]